MAINDCPHCGKPALSPWRKSILGPARSTTCQSCGKRVSVSWGSMWSAAPVLLVAGYPMLTGAPIGGAWFVALILASAVSSVMQWYYVPLVAK